MRKKRRLLLGVFAIHITMQGVLAVNLDDYGQPGSLAATQAITSVSPVSSTSLSPATTTTKPIVVTPTTAPVADTTTTVAETAYSAQGLLINGGAQIALYGPLPNPITSPDPTVAEVTAVFGPPLDPATGLPAPELLVFQPEVEALAKQINLELGVGFGEAFWPDLQRLWYHESLFDSRAVHPSSGACSLVQALPCSKLGDISVEAQIRQMLDYIRRRYADPTGAWNAWKSRGHPCKQQPHPKGFVWCGGWY